MPHPPATELLAGAETRVEAYLDDLAALCALDSGSDDPTGVDAVVGWCAERFVRSGLAVERVPHVPAPGAPQLGDLLLGRRPGRRDAGAGGRRLLLLAHTDTVYGRGTAAARPLTVDGDRVLGPGVADDKGGLLAGLYALELLADAGWNDHAGVVFACSPDEELGSPFSRPHLQALAAAADAGFCLECGRENGDVVSARKGIFDVCIEIAGRAAHAGVEPERGRNAALEAAHKTLALQELNGRWPGVTVNVGVVRAGTRPNVVAERAELHVDVRAPDQARLDEVTAAVAAVAARSWVDGTTARVRQLAAHPPMECTPAVMALVATARQVAAELGMRVGDASTGGAADANTVAAVGLPVLDGLGPVGGDDHSPAEWISRASIAPRLALLAGLLARVGAGTGPLAPATPARAAAAGGRVG